MRFLHPEAAWWFVGLFAAAWVFRLAAGRRRGIATTSSWMFDRMDRASFLRRVPAAIFLAGVLLLGGAVMEPILPVAETEIRSRGLDIVIALDLSSSMEEQMDRSAPPTVEAALGVARKDGRVAGPAPKTRLEATKDAIKTFVARRIDDRIGLVVFSDNAYVVSPLTFDHRYLVRYIDMVDDQVLRGEGMTAIGDGLALSNHLLARQAAAPGGANKVVVVFTDGENTTGRDPLDALVESDAANVRVHLIGVDLEAAITKKPQVQSLLWAVRRYGGHYFNAATSRELDAASRAIDGIEKGVLVSQTYERAAPVFQWFALPALILFAVAFGLRAVPAFIDQT